MASMGNLSDEEIQRRIARFKSANPPDTVSYMERLRPAIIGFHVDGYSRQMMFKGLTAENLISCSRSAFYRWLDANVDLDKEARAFIEKRNAQQLAAAGAPQTNAVPAPPPTKTAQQKEGRAAAPGEKNVARAQPAESGDAASAGGKTRPDSTTVKSTVESTHDTTESNAEDERLRLMQTLNSTLQAIESQDMGAVSDRAHARLAQRDQGRGGRDG